MTRFAISDIHGCYYTFKELLNTIGLNKSDELILLGDYINRGSYSKEVVDLVMQLETDQYNIHCIKGNHEDMIFDSILYDDEASGEPETLKSFGISNLREIPKKYTDWFLNLKPYHISGNYILVHAGLDFKQKHLLTDNRNMYWINFWYEDIDYERLGDKIIIHGHKSVEKQDILSMRDDILQSQVLAIDNGCFKTDQPGLGSLCCFNLDTKDLYFEPNRELKNL
ncbi:metallophosphoesterase family protein [Marivirga salinae]|uniref:Metallophosphoesterase family protein n=1 Tax=Marivirga salinarum TaxID=3059078 RepID=A0AA49GEQ7_9BACT|nr:metallophosphoesterase family protein [Marivirga sp. BDSF4-3]WKK77912.2 metallophosphoesterase family protein [Marivirga sp. BDSF4-3]